MDPLWFSWISVSSAALPIVMGFFQWRQLENNLKPLLWVSVISLIADAISLVLIRFHSSTWPVLNLFYIVQLVAFFMALGHQRSIPRLRIFFYGCLCFAAFNFFFIQTPIVLNTYTAYAGGILMIISSLAFLYQLMNELPGENLQALPLFWLAFGVLIYYGGTLFLFLFNNYLVEHLPESHYTIWVLHSALNITKNVFLFTALWVNYKSKTSPL